MPAVDSVRRDGLEVAVRRGARQCLGTNGPAAAARSRLTWRTLSRRQKRALCAPSSIGLPARRGRALQRRGPGRRLSKVPGSGLAVEGPFPAWGGFWAGCGPPVLAAPQGWRRGEESVLSVYWATEVIGTSSTSWE